MEYLKFVGEAKGLKGDKLKNQIENVIELTKIGGVKHRRISNLSKGYRQRVGIAQALLGNPKVIILDEPTVGLDPLQIIEIRDLIKELGKTHTVILSSHILSEVQAICDKILIISKGKLIAFDNAENLEKNLTSSGEIHIRVDGDIENIRNSLDEIVHIEVSSVREENDCISLTIKTDAEDVNKVSRSISSSLFENNVALLEMSVKKVTLEDVFIELTEDTYSDTGREDGE